MPNLITFQELLKKTQRERKNLLLGNGFSIDYSAKFANESLTSVARKDPVLSGYFCDHLGNCTYSFEEAIGRAKTKRAELKKDEAAYQEKYAQYNKDLTKLYLAMIEAVAEAVANCGEGQLVFCAKKLQKFKYLFTTNSDPLLYWVINTANSLGDWYSQQKHYYETFSEGVELRKNLRAVPKDSGKKSSWLKVLFLHGALHLYSYEKRTVKIKATPDSQFFERLKKIIEGGREPIYIGGESSAKKLEQINQEPYTKACLASLGKITGNLIIYGHEADEVDQHLYETIFSSELRKVYVGVKAKSTEDDKYEALKKRVESYRENLPSNRKEIEVVYYDSTSLNFWSKKPQVSENQHLL